MGNPFNKKGPIHIGVIEDDRVYRRALELLLSNEKDFEVVFALSSIDEILAEKSTWKEVDIILLDLKLGREISIESLPAIRTLCPQAKVIMVTAFFELGMVNFSIRNKVEGYYLKGSSLKLPEMIRAVNQGFTVYDPLVNEKLSSQMQKPEQAYTQFQLTNKESQVAELLANGFSYKAISDRQKISLNTVRQHVRNIYRKMEVNSRYELIQKLQNFT